MAILISETGATSLGTYLFEFLSSNLYSLFEFLVNNVSSRKIQILKYFVSHLLC